MHRITDPASLLLRRRTDSCRAQSINDMRCVAALAPCGRIVRSFLTSCVEGHKDKKFWGGERGKSQKLGQDPWPFFVYASHASLLIRPRVEIALIVVLLPSLLLVPAGDNVVCTLDVNHFRLFCVSNEKAPANS